MALTAGTRIGAYEIQSPLGAGGMGEVYRARDTRLGREVAVKILPDEFLHDPERVARFQREAQVLAALNHPNIAQIFGFEEGPAEAGPYGQRDAEVQRDVGAGFSRPMRALVMELVEGPTLADRIAGVPGGPEGPPLRTDGRRGGSSDPGSPTRTPARWGGAPSIPIDEALPIARQIAEALEAAHEQGIIHRDLKPANVKVRPDGTVKVLDFGLAKLAGPAEAGPYVHRGVGAGFSRPDATASPTITSPAMMTGAGMILGTAAYMAPEQARGKAVDKRADIWAFGCVLYEMLTGQRPFVADDVSDTLAMILMKDPDWSRIPAATPTAIRTLLRRCLEKDRMRRLPDIGVARLEIDEALAAPPVPSPSTQTVARRGGQRLAWIVASVASVAAIGLAALHFTESEPQPPSPIRFHVSDPADASFPSSVSSLALSPDGRRIAFQIAPPGAGVDRARLAIRAFDADDTRELPGTEGVTGSAFWSPDSRFIAFFAGGKLKRVDVTGGPPQVLCDAAGRGGSGSWSSDGTIVFGGESSGLVRVSSGGGKPVPLTMLDATQKESSHNHPWFLPDGRHFLFVIQSAPASGPARSVYVGSLDDTSRVAVVASDSRAIHANGFLLFTREGALLAQPFDAARLLTAGDPVVLAQDVSANPTTAVAAFSASETGVLSYRTASIGAPSELVWLDRSGKRLATVGEKVDQLGVALSPDGARVAVSVLDPVRRTRDLWIHDLTRGLRTRFTFNAGEDLHSTWSPDGRRLAVNSGRPAPLDLYLRAADGSGGEERLVEGGGNKYITSWSPDGSNILYYTGTAGSQTGSDLWVLALTDDRKPRPLLQTPFNEAGGQFSPDARWVAYTSDESGRGEVYVMPFPMGGGKWQVSAAGANHPRWRSDGKELFYLAGDTMMAAEVNGDGSAFQVGAVQRLFEVRRRIENYRGFGIGGVFDVAPDGKRFLVNVLGDEQTAPSPITVITNWTATLR